MAKYSKKFNPQRLLWDARETTSHAIRHDKWVNQMFGSADAAGLRGDSRFVVLAARLIEERKKLIEDRALYAEALRLRELTLKKAPKGGFKRWVERTTAFLRGA